jgi:hypothetical protein
MGDVVGCEAGACWVVPVARGTFPEVSDSVEGAATPGAGGRAVATTRSVRSVASARLFTLNLDRGAA